MEATQMLWDDDAMSEPVDVPPDDQAGTLVVEQEGTGVKLEYPLRFGATIVGRASGDAAEEEARLAAWREEAEKAGEGASVQGLFLPGGSLSKRHARLDLDASGELWFLTDLRSLNGTFIARTARGVRCTPEVKHGLASGDAVRFGSVEAMVILKLVGDPGSLQREVNGGPADSRCKMLKEEAAEPRSLNERPVQNGAASEEEPFSSGEGADGGENGAAASEGVVAVSLGEEELLNAATLPYEDSLDDDVDDGERGAPAGDLQEPQEAAEASGAAPGSQNEQPAGVEEDAEGAGASAGEGHVQDCPPDPPQEPAAEAAEAEGGESDATQPPESPGVEVQQGGAVTNDPAPEPHGSPSAADFSGWRRKSSHTPATEDCGRAKQLNGGDHMTSAQDALAPELAATAAALRDQVLQDAKERLRVGAPTGSISIASAPGIPKSTPSQFAAAASTPPLDSSGGWKVRGRKSSGGGVLDNRATAAPDPYSSLAAVALGAERREGADEELQEQGLQGGISAAHQRTEPGDVAATEPAKSGGSSDVTMPPMGATPAEAEAGDEAGSSAPKLALLDGGAGAAMQDAQGPEVDELDGAFPETLVVEEGEEAALLNSATVPCEVDDVGDDGGAAGEAEAREEAELLNSVTVPCEVDNDEDGDGAAGEAAAHEEALLNSATVLCEMDEEGNDGGAEGEAEGREEAALLNSATVPCEAEEQQDGGEDPISTTEAKGHEDAEANAAATEADMAGKEEIQEFSRWPRAEALEDADLLNAATLPFEEDDEQEIASSGSQQAPAAVSPKDSGAIAGLDPQEDAAAVETGLEPRQECLGHAEEALSVPADEVEEDVEMAPVGASPTPQQDQQAVAGEETQEVASALKKFGAISAATECSPALAGSPGLGEATQGAAQALLLGRMEEAAERPEEDEEPAQKRGRRAKSRAQRGTPEEADAAPPTRGSGRKRTRGTPTPKEASPGDTATATAAKRSRRSTAAAGRHASPDILGNTAAAPEADAAAEEVRVAFSTCIGAKLLKSHTQAVVALGGSVCSDAQQGGFTHLVTMEGKQRDGKGFIRSFKTYLALAAGHPIVDHRWVDASRRAGRFLPVAPEYLLRDPEAENAFRFSIAESYRKAVSGHLALEGFKVFFSPAFLKTEKDGGDNIRKLVRAAGGEPSASLPKGLAKTKAKRGRGGKDASPQADTSANMVVAVEEDREWARRTLRQGIAVRGRDHLLGLLMRQEVPAKDPGPKERLFVA